MSTTDAPALPAALAVEIAALPPFTSYEDAVSVINGALGVRAGIRGRYLSRLYAAARAHQLSDQLVHDIGENISRQCDRAIALHAPIVDKNHGPHGPHGWTGVPIDCLTETEKETLT